MTPTIAESSMKNTLPNLKPSNRPRPSLSSLIQMPKPYGSRD